MRIFVLYVESSDVELLLLEHVALLLQLPLVHLLCLHLLSLIAHLFEIIDVSLHIVSYFFQTVVFFILIFVNQCSRIPLFLQLPVVIFSGLLCLFLFRDGCQFGGLACTPVVLTVDAVSDPFCFVFVGCALLT